MKHITLILVGAAGILLAACIPSVNPFYAGKDIRFEPQLLGDWQAQDSASDPPRWRFESEDGKTYKVTVSDEGGRTGLFKATLFNLEDHAFLDLIPAKCDYATNQADLVAFSMFPGHLLFHVAQIAPALELAPFDFDWLEDFLTENPAALSHHRDGDRLLLTASTPELQGFVLKHLARGELFSDGDTLTRTSSNERNTPRQTRESQVR